MPSANKSQLKKCNQVVKELVGGKLRNGIFVWIKPPDVSFRRWSEARVSVERNEVRNPGREKDCKDLWCSDSSVRRGGGQHRSATS